MSRLWSGSTLLVAVGLLGLLVGGCSNSDQDEATAVSYLPPAVDAAGISEELNERIASHSASALAGENVVASIRQLSSLYHANGYLQEAISCYEGLLLLEPDEARWKHLLANILATYGYADQAAELWLETLRLDPDYMPARIRLGDVYLKTNQLDSAKAVYEECLRREKDNPYALVGMARLAVLKEDWPSAREYLEDASSHSEGRIGKDLLVTVYEKLGEDYRAFAIRGEAKASGSYVEIPDAWLNEVMKDCYDPDQLLNLGGIAAFAGDKWAGIEWFKRLLRLNPDHALGHYQMGLVLLDTRQLDDSIRHLKRAIELRPDFSDAWLRLVDVYHLKRDEAEAERVFYEGFMKCPESPAYNLEYARRLAKQGQHEKALPYMRKSIRLNPNEAAPYLALCSSLFGLNRNEEGVEALKNALDVEPGNPVAMTTMCFYAILTGNQEEADYWLRAIEGHPRIKRYEIIDLKMKYAEKFES